MLLMWFAEGKVTSRAEWIKRRSVHQVGLACIHVFGFVHSKVGVFAYSNIGIITIEGFCVLGRGVVASDSVVAAFAVR